MAKKDNQASFKTRLSFRRKVVTLNRVIRYGFENFVRNAWLSLAAVIIMTITLMIIIFATVSNRVVYNTVDSIRDKVDMSIYTKTDAKQEDINTIIKDIKNLKSVKEVSYVSPAAAREKVARENVGNKETMTALNEAINSLPGTLHIKIEDINDPSELEKYVKENSLIKANLYPKSAPSFASDRRQAIDNIASKAKFIEKAGIVLALIFTVIAILVIFNTIRMAIFNRKDEIYMMRLIGANPGFIRGPFIIEAIINGILSAIIASGLSIVLLKSAKNELSQAGIQIDSTLNLMTQYWYLFVLAVIILGSLIGVISSNLATRKYLKYTNKK